MDTAPADVALHAARVGAPSNHPLKGEWAARRECHGGVSEAASRGSHAAIIGGDFLLIYRLDGGAGKGGAIVFVQAGTRRELFGA